eukprot:maker-scaffold_3-snap-gene-5.3-mRNA-1 protein AED:0.01 eAED:0.01 QI:414/1/1/1/1/1/4/251/353
MFKKSYQPKPITSFNDEYIFNGKNLGKGKFASVKEAVNRKHKTVFAVKVIDKTKLKKKQLKRMHKEVDLLHSFKHDNIVRVYDAYENNDDLYMLMELVRGGDLVSNFGRKQPNQSFTELEVQNIFLQLIEALHFCKQNGVVHRDIKPQNILIEVIQGTNDKRQEIKVKLADFNLAYSDATEAENLDLTLIETICGTPQYMAPEIYLLKKYSYKCDVWSSGVVLFFMLSGGHVPFTVNTTSKEKARSMLANKIVNAEWDFEPLDVWANISGEGKDLIKKMLNLKTSKRLSYEQVLDHDWFKLAGNSLGDSIIDTTPMLSYEEHVVLLAAMKYKIAMGILKDEYEKVEKKMHKGL